MNLKKILCTSARPLAISFLSVALTGCVSSGVRNPSGISSTEMRPDERGFVAGTGVDSTDIVTVTDMVAREIMSIPQIANAQGKPSVVLEPVENNTRFPLNKEVFLSRIRAQIMKYNPGKVDFLARNNMTALERERQLKQTGQVTATSDPNVQEFRGADFFLTGKLDGHPTRTRAGVSDYILYTFQLVDARTSAIVYEGFHEVKRQGLEDAAYR